MSFPAVVAGLDAAVAGVVVVAVAGAVVAGAVVSAGAAVVAVAVAGAAAVAEVAGLAAAAGVGVEEGAAAAAACGEEPAKLALLFSPLPDDDDDNFPLILSMNPIVTTAKKVKMTIVVLWIARPRISQLRGPHLFMRTVGYWRGCPRGFGMGHHKPELWLCYSQWLSVWHWSRLEIFCSSSWNEYLRTLSR